MSAAVLPANCAGQIDVISDHAGLAGRSEAAFFLKADDRKDDVKPVGPDPSAGVDVAPAPAAPPAPPTVQVHVKRKLFMHGFPGSFGGATSEAWHVLRLLARRGVDITILATSAERRWVKACEDHGIEVRAGSASNGLINVNEIRDTPGLAGAAVMSFCCDHFLARQNAAVFEDLRCKRIWVNCMTWLFDGEKKIYDKTGPFEAYVFQSNHQRKMLEPKLAKWGFRPEQGHLIRGAFEIDDFPFRPMPHPEGGLFVVGRLSRPDADKFSSNQIPIYAQARKMCAGFCEVRARIMAWNAKTARKCGGPPKWCQTLACNTEPAVDFLQSLHLYCQYNGGAGENWPRSGLEAMATGVPLVVQDQWGWKEMVEDCVTGRLCDDEPASAAVAIALLANDEDTRMGYAEAGRKRCEELTNPDVIWAGWEKLLDSLEG